MEFIKTLLIACIPALIAGAISFLVAKSQASNAIKQLTLSNKHEIDRLMEQHKVDIDSIQETHRLEMESKEKDHQYKLELLQKEHENEMIRKEHELENTAKYNAAGNIVTGLFNGVLGGAFSSPEFQKEVGHQLTDAMRKGKEPPVQENADN